jgi:hypothetical protein
MAADRPAIAKSHKKLQFRLRSQSLGEEELAPLRRWSLTFPAAALAFAGAAFPAPSAMGAGWQYYDPDCPIDLGGSKSMKFVALQPKKTIERICEALPDVGAAVIALDAPDSELRELNWDIRILRDVEGKAAADEPTEAETVRRLPLEKHRNGMMNFDHNFAEAGKYVLYARLASDDGATVYVGRRRFTVGLFNNTELYAFLGFGCLVLAVGGRFAYVALRKRETAKTT